MKFQKKTLDILVLFEYFSGLKINLAISSIASINIGKNVLRHLANLAGWEVVEFLITYLGLPLGLSPRRKILWSPIIEKVSKRLDG